MKEKRDFPTKYIKFVMPLTAISFVLILSIMAANSGRIYNVHDVIKKQPVQQVLVRGTVRKSVGNILLLSDDGLNLDVILNDKPGGEIHIGDRITVRGSLKEDKFYGKLIGVHHQNRLKEH